jgi:acyl-CoA reductase-like NAD-dependent aldehyde dehydrogenase
MKNFQVANPFDAEILASLPFNTLAQAERAIEKASQLSRATPLGLPLQDRLKILENLEKILCEDQEKISRQICLEGGKPLKDARAETLRGIEGVRIAQRTLAQCAGTVVPLNSQNATLKKTGFTRIIPKGPILGIGAFNHPFNISVHLIIPAIAAGCPVLIKPSLLTPLSCKFLCEALLEAGLPEGWCQLLLLEDHDCEILTKDSRIRHLNFVGSSAVGWKLRKGLAPGVTCNLEHGGSAPALVDESANLELAAAGLTRAAFYHAGQVCISAQRVYVLEKVYENFKALFLEKRAKLTTANPILESTDVGPLITEAAALRVKMKISDAIAGGAKVLCGNAWTQPNMLEPTILEGTAHHSLAIQEEIFGPVVNIISVKELQHGIALANDVPFSFHASIFTESLASAWLAAEKLEGTCVLINEHPAFRIDSMPFGGQKDSGQGVSGIPYSMRECSYEKLVMFSHT